MRTMKINGYEANALLFWLDEAVKTDSRGKVHPPAVRVHGLTIVEIQDLRDRLFNAHEHPTR